MIKTVMILTIVCNAPVDIDNCSLYTEPLSEQNPIEDIEIEDEVEMSDV
ncbi:MAG TPA: hypothetical protein VNZ45_02635 [Bacteroidia bacterium]|jgi:hypothetical protein|nr:hypothetical protein [Bacteroidia bacterium]